MTLVFGREDDVVEGVVHAVEIKSVPALHASMGCPMVCALEWSSGQFLVARSTQSLTSPRSGANAFPSLWRS